MGGLVGACRKFLVAGFLVPGAVRNWVADTALSISTLGENIPVSFLADEDRAALAIVIGGHALGHPLLTGLRKQHGCVEALDLLQSHGRTTDVGQSGGDSNGEQSCEDELKREDLHGNLYSE